jgi:hypothetical protein
VWDKFEIRKLGCGLSFSLLGGRGKKMYKTTPWHVNENRRTKIEEQKSGRMPGRKGGVDVLMRESKRGYIYIYIYIYACNISAVPGGLDIQATPAALHSPRRIFLAGSSGKLGGQQYSG